MKIDRSHFPWLLLVILVTGVSALLYIANFHPASLPTGLKLPAILGESPPARNTHGGTPLGLIFGSLAFGIFLFAAALGIRKKKRLWPIGNVRFWLKAHIWLTILTIPFVAFHSGFKSGGPHTSWLLALYTVVMVSGILGIILQQFMPTFMKETLPREVVFEQIPYLRANLLEAAIGLRAPIQEAAANSTDNDPSPQILSKFLDEECIPYLASERGNHHPLGTAHAASDIFRNIKVHVAGQWRPRIEKLEGWCEARRLMDLQTKYHHWLHSWLLIHVPASFALIILTAWHAWVGILFLISVPN